MRALIASFGRRVRECRLAMGISQVELGRRSRVTSKFISEIERGTSNPSLETVLLVADALGRSLPDLLQAEKS
jgi:transcriptional regulator with XRE-family HTH domain